MRVLFCSTPFWPSIGGRQIFGLELVLSLKERGYAFVVMTSHDDLSLRDKTQYKGIPINRFPLRTVLMDRDLNQLMVTRREVIDLKRTFGPDLVHIHGFDPAITLFQIETAAVYRVPLLLTLTEDPPGFNNELFNRTLLSADWVTSKSAEGLTQARQLVPEITPRSSVIHNGLDIPSVLPTPLPFETPRLLCLGRLAVQKGFDVALTALASIIDRFPRVRLIMAGDGPERAKLEQQIADLGLTDKVELVGWVAPDEVPTLINTATVVLMPSRWEGLPSVALQTAMMARPIVATQVGGLPEVVVHQETGLLVNPDDSAGLAEAIAFLLEHPQAAAQMGEAARSRVKEVFSWERCVDQYDALYRQLIMQKSASYA